MIIVIKLWNYHTKTIKTLSIVARVEIKYEKSVKEKGNESEGNISMIEKLLYRICRGGGAKANHIKKLLAFFPNWNSWRTYIEGFTFTFGVVLNLPIYHLAYTDRKIINVNDLDKRVIDLSYLYLFCPEQLYKAQARCLKTQGLLKNISNGKYATEKQWINGLSKWYIVSTAFSAKEAPNIGYRINEYRSHYPLKSSNYYREMNDRLREMAIFSEDFTKFYNRFLKAKSLMVYSDPPYVSAEKLDIYDLNLNKDQHHQLADIHHQLDEKGAKICISYDDHPLVHELYENWYFHDLNIKYSMPTTGRDIKRTELVITNYKPTKQQELPQWFSSL